MRVADTMSVTLKKSKSAIIRYQELLASIDPVKLAEVLVKKEPELRPKPKPQVRKFRLVN